MTITGMTEEGVWDPDAEVRHQQIVIPHFPSETLPPGGTDGAVAIHDTTTGIIYSFWQLKNDGRWKAEQISWADQNGTGWGDPVHYFQGASASGSPNGAGTIRKAEYLAMDEPMYRHALTMTLDFTGLADSGKPSEDGKNYVGAYVFPATSADGWGDKNSGVIPEGSRMMLPADFDVDALPSRELRKIARTLQTYGAYVVDRNFDTPFTIGVQLNIDFELGDTPYNDPDLNDDQDWEKFEKSGIPQGLQAMQRALYRMTECDAYLAADGRVVDPVAGANVNLLSMRGPWKLTEGTTVGEYNTFTQRLEFTDAETVQTRGGRWQRTSWALLQPGEEVRMIVRATNGATLQIATAGDTPVDTGALADGDSMTFTWPANAGEDVTLTAYSGSGDSWIEADLHRMQAPVPMPVTPVASPAASPAS